VLNYSKKIAKTTPAQKRVGDSYQGVDGLLQNLGGYIRTWVKRDPRPLPPYWLIVKIQNTIYEYI